MSSFAIDINDKSSKAKTFLKLLKDYARNNEFVNLEEISNEVTIKAIDDVRKEKVIPVDDIDGLFQII